MHLNVSFHLLKQDCKTQKISGSRRMRWAEYLASMGESRCVCMVWLGKSEGKNALVRPRRGWVDNIKMDLQEVGCGERNPVRYSPPWHHSFFNFIAGVKSQGHKIRKRGCKNFKKAYSWTRNSKKAGCGQKPLGRNSNFCWDQVDGAGVALILNEVTWRVWR